MKISLRIMASAILFFSGTAWLLSQPRYTDYKSLLQKAGDLGRQFPGICTVKNLATTQGGKEIVVLTVGTGDRDNKPGIAVLGGIEGSHLLGRELALGFASAICSTGESAEIKSLLGKVTFYIFPDVSPDASEQYFSALKYERNINARPTDDDRDFRTDEDPYEDLNGDGIITLMRISDPSGNFIESKDDKRVMVTADLSKGESGKYLLYTEGIDNDKDGAFNEDGPGGVCFNRNLSYNYEEFGKNAGLHPVSETETKAVLDFLFAHYNIYATVAFGPQDNLGQPMKASERQGGPASVPGQEPGDDRGPQGRGSMRAPVKISSITKADETVNRLVSDKYHEITGVKGAPQSKASPGNFMEWSYFHYGRYSFSTPAWWYPVEKDKNYEAAFLKYADDNKIENVFVPWTEISHPDFPDKKVEVGGIKPFAANNPPADKLPDLIASNTKFIIALAAMHPDLEFLDVKTEALGNDIFRLTLKVHNKGLFATCSEAGDNNLFTRIMRLTLDISPDQKFLSGQKVQRIRRLEGDQSSEFSWLIQGKGTARLTAGAINTGIISTSVDLK